MTGNFPKMKITPVGICSGRGEIIGSGTYPPPRENRPSREAEPLLRKGAGTPPHAAPESRGRTRTPKSDSARHLRKGGASGPSKGPLRRADRSVRPRKAPEAGFPAPSGNGGERRCVPHPGTPHSMAPDDTAKPMRGGRIPHTRKRPQSGAVPAFRADGGASDGRNPLS